MDFETYKEWTRTTAVYPKEKEEEYLMIGLANEVGEVLGKYKKQVRGDGDKYKEIRSELGDVMWYIARLFDMYDMSMIEVLHENFLKLTDRKERGVLKGDGDTRQIKTKRGLGKLTQRCMDVSSAISERNSA